MDFPLPSLNLFILNILAFLITAFLIPRFEVKGPLSAAAAILVLSLVNSTVWSEELFFTLPRGTTAHSAVIILANGGIFWALAKFLPGLEIRGFLPALVAPVVLTVVSAGVMYYGENIDWKRVASQGVESISALRDQLEKREQRQTAPNKEMSKP